MHVLSPQGVHNLVLSDTVLVGTHPHLGFGVEAIIIGLGPAGTRPGTFGFGTIPTSSSGIEQEW